MKERRRHMRFRADLDADYWPGRSEQPAGRARIEDVSRAGMRVALAERLPKGRRIRFAVQMPDQAVPIMVVGEVVWASTGSPTAGVGICFREVHPLDLARMLDYLYARWLGG